MSNEGCGNSQEHVTYKSSGTIRVRIPGQSENNPRILYFTPDPNHIVKYGSMKYAIFVPKCDSQGEAHGTSCAGFMCPLLVCTDKAEVEFEFPCSPGIKDALIASVAVQSLKVELEVKL